LHRSFGISVKIDIAQSVTTNSQLSVDLVSSARANAALDQRFAQLKDARMSLWSIAAKYEKLINGR
jgi:hypothetical protein